MADTTNTDTTAASGAASQPVLQTVVKYLCGEGPLCGVWFGDGVPAGEEGSFWWRRYLRAALAAPAAQEAEPAYSHADVSQAHAAGYKLGLAQAASRPQADAGAVRAVLEQLERANDDLCALRTQEQYLSMINSGQQEALEALDDARRAARAALAASPQAPAAPTAAPTYAEIETFREAFDWEGYTDPRVAQRAFGRAVLARWGAAAPAQATAPTDAAHKAAVDHAHEILSRLLYHRDGDYFVNVNRAGAEAMHVSTVATIVHAALIGAAAPAQEAAPLTHAELEEVKRAADDIEDCGETDVDYDLLLRAAMAGYLECTRFQVLDQSALDRAAARARQEGQA